MFSVKIADKVVPLNTGFYVSNIWHITPILKMSDFSVNLPKLSISGAIYPGVPHLYLTNKFYFLNYLITEFIANPKWAI